MIQLAIQSGGIIFIYATIWFIISVIKKRNDIADIAWGIGYVLLCIFYIFTQEYSLRAIILYSLVILWGVRLSVHISVRNKGKTEDFRYLNWRNEWGKSFLLRSYFQVYLLQGFFLLIIISPVAIVAAHTQPDLSMLDFIGIAVWCIGFYFQTVGDFQLLRFIKNPLNKGQVMSKGLWKYTRHPNYFGEVTMWWGIFLISFHSPYGIYGLVSPLVITFLIVFVSGLPMLERRYDGNPQYEAYRKRTSRFFPWFQGKFE